jgi:hypothetical protein
MHVRSLNRSYPLPPYTLSECKSYTGPRGGEWSPRDSIIFTFLMIFHRDSHPTHLLTNTTDAIVFGFSNEENRHVGQNIGKTKKEGEEKRRRRRKQKGKFDVSPSGTRRNLGLIDTCLSHLDVHMNYSRVLCKSKSVSSLCHLWPGVPVAYRHNQGT